MNKTLKEFTIIVPVGFAAGWFLVPQITPNLLAGMLVCIPLGIVNVLVAQEIVRRWWK